MTWKGPLVVIAVTTLILFTVITSQLFVIWPYLGNRLSSYIILSILNYCALMTFIHYFLTCFIHPGSVPPHWIPRQQAFVEVKKSTHTPRFCKTCKNHKPPRTHHCSVCDQCVLKMDHHCPWVNNCVGYYNYCHFIRFLIYVDITSVFTFVLLCCRLSQVVQAPDDTLEITFLSLNLIFCGCVIIAVGILTCYHLYCISTNTTTIEGWEKGRSLTIKGMGRIQNVRCAYTQGMYKNICSVLGPWYLWLLPRPMSGDGLEFPLNAADHDFSSTVSLSRPSFTSDWSYEMPALKLRDHPSSFTFVSTATTLVDTRKLNHSL